MSSFSVAVAMCWYELDIGLSIQLIVRCGLSKYLSRPKCHYIIISIKANSRYAYIKSNMKTEIDFYDLFIVYFSTVNVSRHGIEVESLNVNIFIYIFKVTRLLLYILFSG